MWERSSSSYWEHNTMSSYQIYIMNLFSLSMQYINIKSLLLFSMSDGVSDSH